MKYVNYTRETHVYKVIAFSRRTAALKIQRWWRETRICLILSRNPISRDRLAALIQRVWFLFTRRKRNRSIDLIKVEPHNLVFHQSLSAVNSCLQQFLTDSKKIANCIVKFHSFRKNVIIVSLELHLQLSIYLSINIHLQPTTYRLSDCRISLQVQRYVRGWCRIQRARIEVMLINDDNDDNNLRFIHTLHHV